MGLRGCRKTAVTAGDGLHKPVPLLRFEPQFSAVLELHAENRRKPKICREDGDRNQTVNLPQDNHSFPPTEILVEPLRTAV